MRANPFEHYAPGFLKGSERRNRIFLPVLIAALCALAGCAPQVIAPATKRPAGIYHTVKAGENLFRIGKAYDLSYAELARINGIRDPGQIRVGQRIFIPGVTQPLPVEMITPADPFYQAPIYPEGAEPAADGFLWPVSGTVNSPFGPRGASFHDGVDIAAPEGTPIRSIEAGEVIYSEELRGYGNIVILRHADGFISVYAHNQTNLVREGQKVARGDVVARVGSTGRVSGPHLHFEIRKNNAAQDPLRYLPQLCCQPASDSVASGG